MNIVTGKIGPDKVNVDNAVHIGQTQMVSYESGWPETFNGTLSTKVVTMAVGKKSIKCGAGSTFDTQLIYSSVMGLMVSRNIDLHDVFNHELTPIPRSMFENSGEMRITKSKSTLKRNLQVENSVRTVAIPKVSIIDGCAILWCIHWPTK